MKNISFKAVMFDYDGTITKKGEFAPSEEMNAVLRELCEKGFPVAVCTGRQLTSFVRRSEKIFENFSEKARENFYVFAENGAIGYKYDISSKEYRMFYMGQWPSEVPKESFKKNLLEATKDIAEDVGEHLIPIVLRPIDALSLSIDEVYAISDKIFSVIKKFVEGGDAKNYLRFGNSGLGCLVYPASADKDSAIKIFYEFLKNERGVVFEEDNGKYQEIMVIGDNPQVGGNDHFFLNGVYGTPYTVGTEENDTTAAKVVFDKNGARLYRDEATLYLLRGLLDNAIM